MAQELFLAANKLYKLCGRTSVEALLGAFQSDSSSKGKCGLSQWAQPLDDLCGTLNHTIQYAHLGRGNKQNPDACSSMCCQPQYCQASYASKYKCFHGANVLVVFVHCISSEDSTQIEQRSRLPVWKEPHARLAPPSLQGTSEALPGLASLPLLCSAAAVWGKRKAW